MSTELAWAAGFFDGEGYTGYVKSRTLVLHVSQVHREPLDRFQAAVGIGKVYGPYGPYQKNHSPHFQYRAQGATVACVLDSLWPWLTSIKRAQAEVALVAFRTDPRMSKAEAGKKGAEMKWGKSLASPKALSWDDFPEWESFQRKVYRDYGSGDTSDLRPHKVEDP